MTKLDTRSRMLEWEVLLWQMWRRNVAKAQPRATCFSSSSLLDLENKHNANQPWNIYTYTSQSTPTKWKLRETTRAVRADCDKYTNYSLFVTDKDIWIDKNLEKRGITVELSLTNHVMHIYICHSYVIMCSKIHLDDLKTMGGVWNATFH